MFSTISIQIDKGSIPGLALAPIAVLPGFQSQGIGSQLIKRGLVESKRLGYKFIVVVGHPEYYPRFGFTSARAKGLEAPFEVPDEAFMVFELFPGALDYVKGLVMYPPEFGI